MSLHQQLRQVLWSADFDGGVKLLNAAEWRNLDRMTHTDALETQWIAAELFDYAGRYADAVKILIDSGPRSTNTLTEILRSRDPRASVEADRHAYKQHCLIAIQWAFTFYRRHDYSEALKRWNLCFVSWNDA